MWNVVSKLDFSLNVAQRVRLEIIYLVEIEIFFTENTIDNAKN